MIVGPTIRLTSHGLYGMHANYGLQSSVMSFWSGNSRTAIVYHIAVVFDESLNQLLWSHEYSAVLMSYGKQDCTRLVLERLEVFGTMGTINLMPIAVVVDVPPVTDFGRGRSLREALRKRL